MSSAASSPSRLVLPLFAPGMSPLHRAGIGGLASTLRWIERAAKEGAIKSDELPGGPWNVGAHPWRVDPREVCLDFGKAEAAAGYLQRLFRLSFRLNGGLIHLPGQYPQPEPPFAVRAYLQQGLLLTFLQHGKSRDLAKGETPYSYQPEDDGKPPIELKYRECSGYKHQNGWKDLVDEKTGRLTHKPIEIVGPMNPGAMVRHNAFAARTKLEEPPEKIIALYFALVGCLALSVNRGVGVLVVPEVSDLEEFARIRPFMTPRTDRDCQITSAGDAALQADVRIQAQAQIMNHDLPGCQAVTFRPTPWASQQKSRVHAMNILPGCEIHLERFAVAMDELPPRLIQRTNKETLKVDGKKQKVERSESFWAASIVRPLVADNLAQARPWYRGFVDLMTKIDAANKRPVRDKLFFEKKGLHSMIENQTMWQDRGESAVVQAVHEALRRRFGKIADENKGNSGPMKNRMKRERERWRLAFAGAKTPAQFRYALCDLFSRAGISQVLQTEWQGLLPMLSDQSWQLTRDLSLLGLASYAGKGAKEVEEPEVEN